MEVMNKVNNMYDTYPICDTHKQILEKALGEHIRFYPMDETAILGNYTACIAYSVGCRESASYRHELDWSKNVPIQTLDILIIIGKRN
tara:strand:+ start:69 stop:332 length:264 start_codon:yes stop_codon:yes gene_type:complete